MPEILTQIIFVFLSGFENTAIRPEGHVFGEPPRLCTHLDFVLDGSSSEMRSKSVLRQSDRVVRGTDADHCSSRFQFEENAAISVMNMSFDEKEKTCMFRGTIL